MIIKEFFLTREDDVNLFRAYSDQNFLIQREDGILFEEAVDIEGSLHTYVETDIEIEHEIFDDN